MEGAGLNNLDLVNGDMDDIMLSQVIWEKNVFSDKSAESLQCTMFFYVCKLFGLRGQDEHRCLTCDQLTVGSDIHGKYVEFSGRSSKTYKGDLKDLELSNKWIRHYSQHGMYRFGHFLESTCSNLIIYLGVNCTNIA